MREISFEEAKRLYFEIAGDSGRYNAVAAQRIFTMGKVLNKAGVPYASFKPFAKTMNYYGLKAKRRRVMSKPKSKENKDLAGV